MPDSGGQTNVQISGKAALFVGKHGSATVMLVCPRVDDTGVEAGLKLLVSQTGEA